jgi:hypothetical protein
VAADAELQKKDLEKEVAVEQVVVVDAEVE